MKSIERSSSGGVLMIVVFYTLALFNMLLLQVVWVIEYFAPRLIQDTLCYRLFVLCSTAPKRCRRFQSIRLLFWCGRSTFMAISCHHQTAKIDQLLHLPLPHLVSNAG